MQSTAQKRNGQATNGRQRGKKAKVHHAVLLGPVVQIDIKSIYPSPENEKLYRPIDPNDPDIKAMSESMRANGVLEPLVVSEFFWQEGTHRYWILSGHRRHAAAKLAGLLQVPCQIHPIYRDQNPDGFLVLLREYNRQRTKNLDEIVAEEVVSTNPNEAHRKLLDYRREQQSEILDAIDTSGARVRKRISAAKRPFLDAIKKILDELSDHWPLSDRRIHYNLANDPPLIHASKPGSRYRLDDKSYDALTDLLTRGRIAGGIPWEAISDDTRPVCMWNVWANPQLFVRKQLAGFLKGYWRNYQQSQSDHIEITGEKSTAKPTIDRVAQDYCIPTTMGRGFCSIQPRHDMAMRFRKSGKNRLVVFIVSDLDPAGEKIAQSFAESMARDFSIRDVQAVKVALTYEQVQQFKLPSGGRVKKSKNNAHDWKGFVDKYGDNVWELESMPIPTLQQILRNAIDSVIDMERFNYEVEAERRDAAELEAKRKQFLRVLREMKLADEE